MTCPVCDQDVPIDHAVEWDCEPAPGSGKWGMSVCKTCHDGIYGLITPWEWAQTVIQRERALAKDQRAWLRKLRDFVESADDLIP